jgi:hypothetical protein
MVLKRGLLLKYLCCRYNCYFHNRVLYHSLLEHFDSYFSDDIGLPRRVDWKGRGVTILPDGNSEKYLRRMKFKCPYCNSWNDLDDANYRFLLARLVVGQELQLKELERKQIIENFPIFMDLYSAKKIPIIVPRKKGNNP